MTTVMLSIHRRYTAVSPEIGRRIRTESVGWKPSGFHQNSAGVLSTETLIDGRGAGGSMASSALPLSPSHSRRNAAMLS